MYCIAMDCHALYGTVHQQHKSRLPGCLLLHADQFENEQTAATAENTL
jgi:hypothetical protein